MSSSCIIPPMIRESVEAILPNCKLPVTVEEVLDTESFTKEEAAQFMICSETAENAATFLNSSKCCNHAGCEHVRFAIESIAGAVDYLVHGDHIWLPNVCHALDKVGFRHFLYNSFELYPHDTSLSGMSVYDAFWEAFDEYDAIECPGGLNDAKELTGRPPFGGFECRQSRDKFEAEILAVFRDVFQPLGPKAAHMLGTHAGGASR